MMMYNRTKNKASFFLLLSLLFSFSIQAQDHKVSGVVTHSESGEGIRGVLVAAKGVQSIR